MGRQRDRPEGRKKYLSHTHTHTHTHTLSPCLFLLIKKAKNGDSEVISAGRGG